MAKESFKNDTLTVEQQPCVEKKQMLNQANSIYKISELAISANRFKVPRECVEAAFKTAGKTEATLSEAKKIISDFMKREVK